MGKVHSSVPFSYATQLFMINNTRITAAAVAMAEAVVLEVVIGAVIAAVTLLLSKRRQLSALLGALSHSVFVFGISSEGQWCSPRRNEGALSKGARGHSSYLHMLSNFYTSVVGRSNSVPQMRKLRVRKLK